MFTEALGEEPMVQFLDSLYHAGLQALASALADVPDEVSLRDGHRPQSGLARSCSRAHRTSRFHDDGQCGVMSCPSDGDNWPAAAFNRAGCREL